MSRQGDGLRFKDATLQGNGGRTLLADVGRPVQLHHVPNWLRLVAIKKLGLPWHRHAGWAVVEELMRRYAPQGAGWLDHWGSSRRGDQVVFVSEPYGLTHEALAGLLALADDVGVDLSIDATSSWFPTRTLRIELSPRSGPGAPRAAGRGALATAADDVAQQQEVH
jgi:hypothetical protein